VPRQEYLANSFSRNIPWEAKGISRRTWERRRKKAMVDAAASLSGFACVASARRAIHVASSWHFRPGRKPTFSLGQCPRAKKAMKSALEVID
jgi:hypothetical protein